MSKALLRVLSMFLVVVAALVTSEARAAPSPVGYWLTIDDDGKTPKSVIKIVERGNKLFGTVVQLINPSRKDPTCDECEGANRGKPIVGMQIMWNLSKDGDEWSGGHILDPKNGKVYKCYVELVENGARLKVRGYIGIALLGRTQYWRRTTKP